MGEGIQRLGGDTTQLGLARRQKGSLAAFLELHIEQGGILDSRKLDIGIVEGIVGLNWWDVHFKGMANHAGTTPMNLRKDALLAAARFIEAVNEEAKALAAYCFSYLLLGILADGGHLPGVGLGAKHTACAADVDAAGAGQQLAVPP